MPLFSSSQPSLRARLLPKFPARVIAGSGMTITKSGLTYTFESTIADDIPLSSLVDISTNKVLGRTTAGPGGIEELGPGAGIEFTTGTIKQTTSGLMRLLQWQLYNNGSVLTTGVKRDAIIPFACTIREVTLLATPSGSIVIDIWKDTYANYPPTVADTITASAKPTISSAVKSQNATLTGWTTAIAAGDTLRFNIDSVATITRVEICIKVEIS